jgi:hypothetical protein
MARFKSKIIFFRYKNAPAYYNSGVVSVHSKVVGLAPELIDFVFSMITLS